MYTLYPKYSHTFIDKIHTINDPINVNEWLDPFKPTKAGHFFQLVTEYLQIHLKTLAIIIATSSMAYTTILVMDSDVILDD